jgi:hypothetical protein
VSPKVADGILREFYGLGEPDAPQIKPTGVQDSGIINLEDFL